MTRDQGRECFRKFADLPQCVELTHYAAGISPALEKPIAALVNALNAQALVISPERAKERRDEYRIGLLTRLMGIPEMIAGGAIDETTTLTIAEIEKLLRVWQRQALSAGFELAA